MQLRIECAAMMKAQGHEEPTGQAKVTSAYNLPSSLVIHTVGPIVENGKPTETFERLPPRLSELPRRGGGTTLQVHRLLLHLHRRVRVPKKKLRASPLKTVLSLA